MMIRSSKRLARRAALLTVIGALAATSSARADQWTFVGARAQGMGGAGVAVIDDSTATYWNPANLAFDRGYDFQLPATLNGNIENHALEKLSNLMQTYDDLNATLDGISGGTLTNLTTGQTGEAFRFLSQLSQFGGGGDNVNFGIDVGLMGRVHNYGYSALSLTTGTIYADVDLTNIGLVTGGLSLVDIIPDNPTALIPTDSASVAFRDRVQALPGWTTNQANFAANAAASGGVDLSNPGVADALVDAAAATSTGTNAFANNNTGAVIAGLSTQEFAFTYSHTLPVPFRNKMPDSLRAITKFIHNRIALGGNIKYMMGIAYAKAVRYDDGNDSLIGELANFSDSEISHNWGLDLGITYRPFQWLRFGMVARNVNSPSFAVPKIVFTNGAGVDEVSIDAQVRFGAAFLPIRHLTLALDIDATANKIATLPGFESRILSVGAEYEIPFGKHIGLALRLGGYNNVASDVESDWAMTGGLGLRLWQFVIDASAGGSFSKDRVVTDSDSYIEIPTRMNAGITLKWEKSL